MLFRSLSTHPTTPTAVAGLGGATQQLGNDLAWLLTPLARNLLQAFGVVALDAHENRKLRVWVTAMDFDLPWRHALKLSVEITWLRIGVAPGVSCHLSQGFYAHGRWLPNP